MTVDVEDGRAVFLGVDHMRIPQLVVQGLGHGLFSVVTAGDVFWFDDYATQDGALR